MARRTNVIGVYGGTFDPIHLGHIHLIKSLLQQGWIDSILLVPAKQNPLKLTASKIPDDMRLKLIEAALKELNHPKVELFTGELKRQGFSYTKDTLKELKTLYQDELALIVGDEVFKDFPKWKDPKTILTLANLIVVQRTPSPIDTIQILTNCGISDFTQQEEDQFFSNQTRWVRVVKINALPHCATQIRNDLAKAWKIGDLSKAPQGIQRSVWLLIKENQLYAVN